MALPDWNADLVAGKKIVNPAWSPCSPTETSVRKQLAARHAPNLNAGATIADSSSADTWTPKNS